MVCCPLLATHHATLHLGCLIEIQRPRFHNPPDLPKRGPPADRPLPLPHRRPRRGPPPAPSRGGWWDGGPPAGRGSRAVGRVDCVGRANCVGWTDRVGQADSVWAGKPCSGGSGWVWRAIKSWLLDFNPVAQMWGRMVHCQQWAMHRRGSLSLYI